MAGKKQLDPVESNTAAPSVSDATEHGTLLEQMKSTRRIVAAHIDSPNTLARDLAPLVRQYTQLSERIDELERRDAAESRRGRKRTTGKAATSNVIEGGWDASAV